MYNHGDDERFIYIMAAFAEASGQESTPLKERIYAEGLCDIPIEVIEKAAWQLIRTRTFATFPKVGELRELIGGKAEDIAELEAAKVWKAISQVGGYSGVCFDNPVTQAVIEYGFGGWSKLCGEMMVDQQKWFIKDFIKTYSAFSRQNIQLTGPLLGRGAGTGDGVKLIGNPEAALLIMNTPGQKNLTMVTEASSIAQALISRITTEEMEEP